MGIFSGLGWPHLIIILVIIVLLFGAAKLPALSKSLGQSIKIFRSEMKTPEAEKSESSSTTASAEPAADAQAKPKS